MSVVVRVEQIEGYLHRHIPISRELGVRVLAVDENGVRLGAPLAPNINHRNTVFGGSVSTLAILSAWTLVHVRFREDVGAPGRVLIQRNSLEYLRPMHGDFEAVCPVPPAAEWERFIQAIHRRGRGRILLNAEVLCEGERGAVFQGVYVAHAPHFIEKPVA